MTRRWRSAVTLAWLVVAGWGFIEAVALLCYSYAVQSAEDYHEFAAATEQWNGLWSTTRVVGWVLLAAAWLVLTLALRPAGWAWVGFLVPVLQIPLAGRALHARRPGRLVLAWMLLAAGCTCYLLFAVGSRLVSTTAGQPMGFVAGDTPVGPEVRAALFGLWGRLSPVAHGLGLGGFIGLAAVTILYARSHADSQPSVAA